MSVAYAVHISLTNETAGHIFSEWTDELDPDTSLPRLFHEDGSVHMGELFRLMRSEYGRCTSSVYVDGPPTRRVGWYFESRHAYEDTGEPYLRGAWVTVVKRREDYQPAKWGE